MYKTREFPEHNYKAIFIDGKTLRIALDPSKEITELDYPEFYDVKITNKCDGKCKYCYMDSTSYGQHAENPIEKIQKFFGIMDKNQKPFQVAIGGGEPTMHPEFIDILKEFYTMDVMPNYTTNGMNISNEILWATKEYCGGVAISAHEHIQEKWVRSVDKFIQAGVKLNFHHVISNKKSIDYFRRVFDSFEKVIDHFVLLPYTAKGRAIDKDIDWEYLVKVMPEDHSKIAFGAGFYSYLRNGNIYNVSLYEPEIMSKYLDLTTMKLYKSSFDEDC